MAGHPLKKIQCESIARTSGKQCRAKGYLKKSGHYRCRFHGGASTGPKTEFGRQRCAAARTIHGFETRRERTERALGMRRLRELEDLGHLLGLLRGARTPGRKPQ